MTPAVVARGVSRSFGYRRAVAGVDVEVPSGGRLALMGPNGAGKTTLLRVLAGLLRPESGTVEILGHDMTGAGQSARGGIGYIGHQPLAYLDLTVRQNLELFADLHGAPATAVDEMLERVGLLARSLDSARDLSRGMIQRLSIGRALINTPSLLLLDEPGAGLDAYGATLLRDAVGGNGGKRPATVLVSHDPAEVVALADRVAVMKAGRIVGDLEVADHTPESLADAYQETLA